MKRITLPKILDCLENMQYEVTMDADLARRAYGSVQRMLEASQRKAA